jgi:hypothetical protein
MLVPVQVGLCFAKMAASPQVSGFLNNGKPLLGLLAGLAAPLQTMSFFPCVPMNMAQLNYTEETYRRSIFVIFLHCRLWFSWAKWCWL